MLFPNELKYTRTHEWVKFETETTAYIGITDFAQSELGDLVFVNLPSEGDSLSSGEAFSDVESVKAVSDVISPVTGVVAKVNEELEDEPEKMNAEPYESWFVFAEDITDTCELLSAEEYEAFIEEEAE